jgi:predicted transcriptional regulator of viral defense system
MKFADLLRKTREMPCFTPGFLDAGEDPAQVRVQISRWVQGGRVLRLHKGLYAVAEPYRGGLLEPFCVANRLKPASYVSLQSALAWHGLKEILVEGEGVAL